MLLGVAQVRGVVIETPEVTPPSSPANLEASDLGAPARWFTLAIATAGGVGFVPGAPGTCGSVVGVLVFAALAGLGLPLFLLTTAALTILGIWASDHAERIFGKKDDGRIVIDEVAGQLIVLAPLLVMAPSEEIRNPLWLVTGFVLFRVFDIWKPGPVRWAERNFKGGAGVVLDDVVAGCFGALALGATLLGAAWVLGSG
jgi:phosphatidylglycerophosphatase A